MTDYHTKKTDADKPGYVVDAAENAKEGVATTITGSPVTQTTAKNPAAGPVPAAPVRIVPDGEGGALTIDAAGQAVNQKADGTPVPVSNPAAIAEALGDEKDPKADTIYKPSTANPNKPAPEGKDRPAEAPAEHPATKPSRYDY